MPIVFRLSVGEQLEADSSVVNALDALAVECRRPNERKLHMNSGEDFEAFREDTLAAVDDVEEAIENR